MNLVNKVIKNLALWLWLASVVIVLFTLIPHLINFLFPDYPVLAKWLVTFDWRVMILILTGLLSFGVSLLLVTRLARLHFFWQKGRSIFITYLITSFWLAYYLTLSFRVFNQYKHCSLIGLTLIFLFWLPNWTYFLSYFKFKDLIVWILNIDFTPATNLSWQALIATPAFLFTLIKKLAILVFLIVVIGGLIFGFNEYLHQKRLKESRQALDPIVTDYQPKIVVGNTKVIIYGDKFGLQQNGKNFLFNQTLNDPVAAGLWTNKKIIFSIPLSWPVGEHILYINRFMFWPEGSQIITAQSQPIKLKVVDRRLKKDGGWPAFLDQIPYLNKEVRKINGF